MEFVTGHSGKVQSPLGTFLRVNLGRVTRPTGGRPPGTGTQRRPRWTLVRAGPRRRTYTGETQDTTENLRPGSSCFTPPEPLTEKVESTGRHTLFRLFLGSFIQRTARDSQDDFRSVTKNTILLSVFLYGALSSPRNTKKGRLHSTCDLTRLHRVLVPWESHVFDPPLRRSFPS